MEEDAPQSPDGFSPKHEPSVEPEDAPEAPKKEEEEHPAAAGVDAMDLAHPEEPDPLSLPPHGCDVYVGGLPRTATEDQIREFASEAGEVYSVKIIRDLANPTQNKGYGFVCFTQKESALRAMDRLHFKELKDFPGQRLRVQATQSKFKLWMGSIPFSLDKAGLQAALDKFALKGLEKVNLAMRNREEPAQGNRGFAFLEFYNAACASQAKRVLTGATIGTQSIKVELVEPNEQDKAIAAGNRTVFVGSLPPGATEDQLRAAFSKYGGIEKVHIPRPREGEEHSSFAFVTFLERLAAARAVDDESPPEVAGATVVVKYGKTESSAGREGAGGRGGGGFAGGQFGGGYGGGRGGGYGGYQQQQQQQQPQQQQPYAYGGMAGGMAAAGMGGMMMMPVQLPNGQMGYMLPGGMMGAAGYDAMGMGGGGVPMRGRGGWRGGGRAGGGGGRFGGAGGGYDAGYGGGRGAGGYRGGRGGTQRYQPY